MAFEASEFSTLIPKHSVVATNPERFPEGLERINFASIEWLVHQIDEETIAK